MTMITPERTSSAAERLSQMTLAAASSKCSEMVEEKKSPDDGNFGNCFREESGIEKQTMAVSHQPVWSNMISNAPGSKFLPEKGRYALYVSRACPSSHTTLLVRTVKGLEDVVSVVFVRPHPDDHLKRRWIISHEIPEDSITSLKSDEGEFTTIREIYQKEHGSSNNNNDSNSTNCIPLLYDKQHECIVNNDANDIAVMLNSCFNDLCHNPSVDLFPSCEGLKEWLYPLLELTPSNTPLYYYALSPLELDYAFHRATTILQKQRYLTSHTAITEADLRLFVALIRYEEVYSKYLLESPPQLLHNPVLMDFCRDVYQLPGVARTVRTDEIQAHFLGNATSNSKYEGAIVKMLQKAHRRHLM